MFLLSGVGYGTLVSTFLFSIYYAVIIGWMFFYFVHSFAKILPWTTCDNYWNVQETEVCISRVGTGTSGETNTGNDTFLGNVTSFVNTSMSTTEMSLVSNFSELKKITPAEQFWK